MKQALYLLDQLWWFGTCNFCIAYQLVSISPQSELITEKTVQCGKISLQYSFISNIFNGQYCLSVGIVTPAKFRSCLEFLEPILFPDQSLSHSLHS